MNRFWKPVFVVWACSLSTSGISWSADPTPVVDNPNTATVATIDLTPAPARVTFKVTVTDPRQPVSLQVGPTNAFEVVKSQLLSTLKEQKGLTLIEAVESTTDATGKKLPHLFKLLFSEGKSFELTIDDGSFSIIPQYYVIATNASTRVTCDLLFANKSPTSLTNTKLSFSGGGVTLHDTHVNLTVGGEIPLLSKFVSKDGVLTDDLSVTLPLAYWANATDFQKNTPKAVLQFPMKENWPKTLTLPGWIHFSYESQKLSDFQYPVASNAAEQSTAFKAVVGQEFLSFKDVRLPVEFGPVTLKSAVENAISDTDKWPHFHYTEYTDYSSADSTGKPVWIRVNDKDKNISYNTQANPKNPVATATVLKSASLVISPGKETAKDLKELHDLLSTLTARMNSNGDAMKKQFDPLIGFLENVATLLNTLEPRIKMLTDHHMKLVQNGASEDVLKISRAKLESAKRAAAALVESYNATVFSYPE